MEASWKQQALRLLAPARLDFVDGVAMDRLRLGFRQAELTVSGRAGSTLDLTATLRNLPADIGSHRQPRLCRRRRHRGRCAPNRHPRSSGRHH